MNEFVIYTGAMFSGKTSRMLLHVEKHRHGGREIHAFKPKIDDRFAVEEIVTHMGWSIPAIAVTDGKEIEERMLKTALDLKKSLLVVDEAFMIPNVADTMIWFYKQGIDVVVASLDLTCWCEPFEEVQKMLPWATKIVKCASACSACGDDAYYSYRKVDNDQELFIGGSESYEPRCRRHHPSLIER